jgi:hypothetical protein
MPVESQRQWRYLAANRPDLLHKWQGEAPVNYRNLPAQKRAKHHQAVMAKLRGRHSRSS